MQLFLDHFPLLFGLTICELDSLLRCLCHSLLSICLHSQRLCISSRHSITRCLRGCTLSNAISFRFLCPRHLKSACFRFLLAQFLANPSQVHFLAINLIICVCFEPAHSLLTAICLNLRILDSVTAQFELRRDRS